MPDGARWHALLASAGPILADGAMGTMLFEAGLMSGDSPERWNVERPDVIRGIHRAYRDAGSRILLTNTFGGNRFRLALHGLDTRVAEVNEAAARLAGEVAHAPGCDAVVAGDIGPSGAILAPLGDLERADAVKGFAEQAAALHAGGVDVFWIETMSALEEVEAAVEGARQAAPGVPIVVTMSFDTHGCTMMGVRPEQAAKELTALGAVTAGSVRQSSCPRWSRCARPRPTRCWSPSRTRACPYWRATAPSTGGAPRRWPTMPAA